jgi:hypothetical protein
VISSGFPRQIGYGRDPRLAPAVDKNQLRDGNSGHPTSTTRVPGKRASTKIGGRSQLISNSGRIIPAAAGRARQFHVKAGRACESDPSTAARRNASSLGILASEVVKIPCRAVLKMSAWRQYLIDWIFPSCSGLRRGPFGYSRRQGWGRSAAPKRHPSGYPGRSVGRAIDRAGDPVAGGCGERCDRDLPDRGRLRKGIWPPGKAWSASEIPVGTRSRWKRLLTKLSAMHQMSGDDLATQDRAASPGVCDEAR